MKTLQYIGMAALALLTAACGKDEPGATATEQLAGQWYVTAAALDEQGSVAKEYTSLGHFLILTYNTAANSGSEIWVDDRGKFWNFKVKASAAALTFATGGAAPNAALNRDGTPYECQVRVEEGRILPGAATTPHHTPADSVVMYVSFSDDSPAFGTRYRLAGYRYTGLTADD